MELEDDNSESLGENESDENGHAANNSTNQKNENHNVNKLNGAQEKTRDRAISHAHTNNNTANSSKHQIKKKDKNNAEEMESFFLYKPQAKLKDLPILQNNTTIEIRIGAEYMNDKNPNLLNREIWGHDGYISTSDSVCILKHFGFNFNEIKENEAVKLSCRVTKSKKTYGSVEKNGLTSKKFSVTMNQHMQPHWRSIKPEKVEKIKSIGKEDTLYLAAKKMKIEPTTRKPLKPVNLKKASVIPEAHLCLNMCQEFAFVYNLLNICDKGDEIKQKTAYQLKSQTLYLESETDRYEISVLKPENPELRDIFGDLYMLAKLKEPELKDDSFFAENRVPLEGKYVDIVVKEFEWKEVLWGNSSIQVKDHLICSLKNFKFYKNMFLVDDE